MISYFFPNPNFLTPNLDFFFVSLGVGVGGGDLAAGILGGGAFAWVAGAGAGAAWGMSWTSTDSDEAECTDAFGVSISEDCMGDIIEGTGEISSSSAVP